MSYETNNITMLQEVIFDLYDYVNGNTRMSRDFAEELVQKLEDLELRLSTPIIVRGKKNE